MRFLALSLAAMLATVASAQVPVGYSLWLVRHAEKTVDGSDDPKLTDAGRSRARNLALWLEGKGIKAVWSSDTARTRQTAQPLADSLDLEVGIYDPRDAFTMAGKLKAEAVNALVVGHSNTIPALAAKLCQCPVEPIEDADYDRLYYLVVVAGQAGLIVSDQTELFGGSQDHKR